MDWRNAPISRVAKIPGAMELTLEEVSLLGGLWKLVQKAPAKVFCWAYFENAFGLTVSKARTRLARLERAGLLNRRMVGDRPSDALGSTIEITPMGKDLLRTLAPLLAQPQSNIEATAQNRTVSAADATPPPARPTGQRITDYPEAFQKGVMKLGAPVARIVNRALDEGRAITREEAVDAGMPGGAADALNAAIEQHRPRNEATHAIGVMGQGGGGEGGAAWTKEIPASESDVVAAREAGVPVPELVVPEDHGVRPIAQLVVAEAAKRYRALLCGRTAAGIAERLNELVWSCTSGPLADFGAPVKRVRVGLKLLAAGRWETPIGYVSGASIRAFEPALSGLRSQ